MQSGIVWRIYAWSLYAVCTDVGGQSSYAICRDTIMGFKTFWKIKCSVHHRTPLQSYPVMALSPSRHYSSYLLPHIPLGTSSTQLYDNFLISPSHLCGSACISVATSAPLQNARKITHGGALRIADRLIRYGMRVFPLSFCGFIETSYHLFFDCPLVSRFRFLLKAHRYRHHFSIHKDVVRFGITRTAACGFKGLPSPDT